MCSYNLPNVPLSSRGNATSSSTRNTFANNSYASFEQIVPVTGGCIVHAIFIQVAAQAFRLIRGRVGSSRGVSGFIWPAYFSSLQR